MAGIRRITLLCLSLGALSTVQAGTNAVIDPAAGCKTNPARVARCFSVSGRIGLYNGSPAIRIAPDGGKRLLGVLPAEEELMPDALKQAVTPEQDAHARMLVCPFSSATAGHMQFVCVESAQDLRPLPR